MGRQTPKRPEELATGAAGKRANGERRIRETEAGGSGLRDRAAGKLSHDRQGVDVGGLALVGRHAKRGVALQELD